MTKFKVKVSEIPNGKYIKSLNNRQIMTFVVPIVIGLLMMVFGRLSVKIFGLLFTVFAIVVLIKFKDKTVVDVYEDFIVVYDDVDEDLVTVIYWKDVVSWDLKISQTVEDFITVETNDNYFININMFGIGRLAKYFRLKVFDKNKQEQFKEAQNKKGSSFIFSSKKSKEQ